MGWCEVSWSERGHVEPFLAEARHELIAVFVLNDGDADFVEAGAFGFEDEPVYASEILGCYPEVCRGGEGFFYGDGFALKQNCRGLR